MGLNSIRGAPLSKNVARFTLIAASGAMVLTPIAASANPFPSPSISRKQSDGPVTRKQSDGPVTRETRKPRNTRSDDFNPFTEFFVNEDDNIFTALLVSGALAGFFRVKKSRADRE